jgi:hypothetical protein
MFQTIKECLEKSSQKWDAGVENSLRKDVNVACKVIKFFKSFWLFFFFWGGGGLE